MLEIGWAARTTFVVRYLYDHDLQRGDRGGLNEVEAWKRANSVICYGRGGEISTNRRHEVEMTALCLRILQASLVMVNVHPYGEVRLDLNARLSIVLSAR